MSPDWHDAFSKADANKDGSLSYHEFANAQVGLLAHKEQEGSDAPIVCGPGQKKIESCIDDKMDFVYEGGCESGTHSVPPRIALPVPPFPSPAPASRL